MCRQAAGLQGACPSATCPPAVIGTPGSRPLGLSCDFCCCCGCGHSDPGSCGGGTRGWRSLLSLCPHHHPPQLILPQREPEEQEALELGTQGLCGQRAGSEVGFPVVTSALGCDHKSSVSILGQFPHPRGSGARHPPIGLHGAVPCAHWRLLRRCWAGSSAPGWVRALGCGNKSCPFPSMLRSNH